MALWHHIFIYRPQSLVVQPHEMNHLLQLWLLMFSTVCLGQQEVHNWDAVEIPPLTRSIDNYDRSTLDSVANRQLLERLYGVIRAPAGLHYQNVDIRMVIVLLFTTEGNVTIDRMYHVDKSAPNYISPHHLDLLMVVAYPPSHEYEEYRNRIRNDPGYAYRSVVNIRKQAIPALTKSLARIKDFYPAMHNGQIVSVRRVFTVDLIHEGW